MKRVMRYHDSILLTPPSAGVATYNMFSANGMYDPNITLTGHQPLGFDQLVGVFYDHYTILAARIKVKFINASTTATMGCGVHTSDTSSAITNFTAITEQAGTKTCYISPGGEPKTLTHYCDIRRVLGRKSLLSDPELKGDVSHNPTEQAYFQVSAWAPSGVAFSASQAICQVTIEYLAVLFEPKKLAQS